MAKLETPKVLAQHPEFIEEPKPLGSFAFTRWVSDTTGSIIETQDALGHKHAATTRIYVQRVAIKRDRRSTSILDRLDV